MVVLAVRRGVAIIFFVFRREVLLSFGNLFERVIKIMFFFGRSYSEEISLGKVSRKICFFRRKELVRMRISLWGNVCVVLSIEDVK